MPADNLFNMAKRSCLKYRRTIEDVGNIPYDMVGFLLVKVDNAAQLRKLETNCEQLIGHTGEVWHALIKRDIPQRIREQFDYIPQDPRHWQKNYRKLKNLVDKEEKKVAEAIGLNLKSIEKPKSGSRLIELGKTPRLPGHRRTGGGTGSASVATRTPAQQGKALLSQLRGKPRVSKPPTMRPDLSSKLGSSKGVVAQAPSRMVRDHQEAMRAGGAPSSAPVRTSAGDRGPAMPPSLSIVEKRRQADEELRRFTGEALKPAPEPKKDLGADSPEKRRVMKAKAMASPLMPQKRRKL